MTSDRIPEGMAAETGCSSQEKGTWGGGCAGQDEVCLRLTSDTPRQEGKLIVSPGVGRGPEEDLRGEFHESTFLPNRRRNFVKEEVARKTGVAATLQGTCTQMWPFLFSNHFVFNLLNTDVQNLENCKKENRNHS